MLLLTALLFNLNSFACEPAPLKNSNPLNYEVVFDIKSIPKGLEFRPRFEDTFSVINNTSKKLMGIRTGTNKIKPSEEDEILSLLFIKDYTKYDRHIDSYEAAIPVDLPKKVIVPQPTDFQVPLFLGNKKFKLLGKIVYSKNPNCNPNIFEEWIDPCIK